MKFQAAAPDLSAALGLVALGLVDRVKIPGFGAIKIDAGDATVAFTCNLMHYRITVNTPATVIEFRRRGTIGQTIRRARRQHERRDQCRAGWRQCLHYRRTLALHAAERATPTCLPHCRSANRPAMRLNWTASSSARNRDGGIRHCAGSRAHLPTRLASPRRRR